MPSLPRPEHSLGSVYGSDIPGDHPNPSATTVRTSNNHDTLQDQEEDVEYIYYDYDVDSNESEEESSIDPNDENAGDIFYLIRRGKRHYLQQRQQSVYPFNIDLPNNISITPLMSAILNGRYSIARMLVEYGANINAVDPYHNSAVLFAAERGNLPMILLLLRFGSVIGQIDHDGRGVLLKLVQHRHASIIHLMVSLSDDGDVDVDSIISSQPIRSRSGNTTAASATLAADGTRSVDSSPISSQETYSTQHLLALRAECLRTFFHCDREGRTALMYACELGDLALIESLTKLAAGAVHASNGMDTSLPRDTLDHHPQQIAMWLAQDSIGMSALAYAVAKGHLSIVKYIISSILQHSAHVSPSDCDSHGLASLFTRRFCLDSHFTLCHLVTRYDNRTLLEYFINLSHELSQSPAVSTTHSDSDSDASLVSQSNGDSVSTSGPTRTADKDKTGNQDRHTPQKGRSIKALKQERQNRRKHADPSTGVLDELNEEQNTTTVAATSTTSTSTASTALVLGTSHQFAQWLTDLIGTTSTKDGHGNNSFLLACKFNSVSIIDFFITRFQRILAHLQTPSLNHSKAGMDDAHPSVAADPQYQSHIRGVTIDLLLDVDFDGVGPTVHLATHLNIDTLEHVFPLHQKAIQYQQQQQQQQHYHHDLDHVSEGSSTPSIDYSPRNAVFHNEDEHTTVPIAGMLTNIDTDDDLLAFNRHALAKHLFDFRDRHNRTTLIHVCRVNNADAAQWLLQDLYPLLGPTTHLSTSHGAMLSSGEFDLEQERDDVFGNHPPSGPSMPQTYLSTHVNLQDTFSKSALIYGLENRELQIALALLESNADINACDSHGKSIAMFAIESGNHQLLSLVFSRQSGVDFYSQDHDNWSVLTYACKYGNYRLFQSLLYQVAQCPISRETLLQSVEHLSLCLYVTVVFSMTATSPDRVQGYVNIVKTLVNRNHLVPIVISSVHPPPPPQAGAAAETPIASTQASPGGGVKPPTPIGPEGGATESDTADMFPGHSNNMATPEAVAAERVVAADPNWLFPAIYPPLIVLAVALSSDSIAILKELLSLPSVQLDIPATTKPRPQSHHHHHHHHHRGKFFLDVTNHHHRGLRHAIGEHKASQLIAGGGNTPLHFACQYGYSIVVSLLLSKSVTSISIRNAMGLLPLHLAFQHRHIGCARLLLKYSPTPADFDQSTLVRASSSPVESVRGDDSAYSTFLQLFDAYLSLFSTALQTTTRTSPDSIQHAMQKPISIVECYQLLLGYSNTSTNHIEQAYHKACQSIRTKDTSGDMKSINNMSINDLLYHLVTMHYFIVTTTITATVTSSSSDRLTPSISQPFIHMMSPLLFTIHSSIDQQLSQTSITHQSPLPPLLNRNLLSRLCSPLIYQYVSAIELTILGPYAADYLTLYKLTTFDGYHIPAGRVQNHHHHHVATAGPSPDNHHHRGDQSTTSSTCAAFLQSVDTNSYFVDQLRLLTAHLVSQEVTGRTQVGSVQRTSHSRSTRGHSLQRYQDTSTSSTAGVAPTTTTTTGQPNKHRHFVVVPRSIPFYNDHVTKAVASLLQLQPSSNLLGAPLLLHAAISANEQLFITLLSSTPATGHITNHQHGILELLFFLTGYGALNAFHNTFLLDILSYIKHASPPLSYIPDNREDKLGRLQQAGNHDAMAVIQGPQLSNIHDPCIFTARSYRRQSLLQLITKYHHPTLLDHIYGNVEMLTVTADKQHTSSEVECDDEFPEYEPELPPRNPEESEQQPGMVSSPSPRSKCLSITRDQLFHRDYHGRNVFIYACIFNNTHVLRALLSPLLSGGSSPQNSKAQGLAPCDASFLAPSHDVRLFAPLGHDDHDHISYALPHSYALQTPTECREAIKQALLTTDSEGYDALFYAIQFAHIDCVHLLLAALSSESNRHHPALHGNQDHLHPADQHHGQHHRQRQRRKYTTLPSSALIQATVTALCHLRQCEAQQGGTAAVVDTMATHSAAQSRLLQLLAQYAVFPESTTLYTMFNASAMARHPSVPNHHVDPAHVTTIFYSVMNAIKQCILQDPRHVAVSRRLHLADAPLYGATSLCNLEKTSQPIGDSSTSIQSQMVPSYHEFVTNHDILEYNGLFTYNSIPFMLNILCTITEHCTRATTIPRDWLNPAVPMYAIDDDITDTGVDDHETNAGDAGDDDDQNATHLPTSASSDLLNFETRSYDGDIRPPVSSVTAAALALPGDPLASNIKQKPRTRSIHVDPDRKYDVSRLSEKAATAQPTAGHTTTSSSVKPRVDPTTASRSASSASLSTSPRSSSMPSFLTQGDTGSDALYDEIPTTPTKRHTKPSTVDNGEDINATQLTPSKAALQSPGGRSDLSHHASPREAIPYEKLHEQQQQRLQQGHEQDSMSPYQQKRRAILQVLDVVMSMISEDRQHFALLLTLYTECIGLLKTIAKEHNANAHLYGSSTAGQADKNNTAGEPVRRQLFTSEDQHVSSLPLTAADVEHLVLACTSTFHHRTSPNLLHFRNEMKHRQQMMLVLLYSMLIDFDFAHLENELVSPSPLTLPQMLGTVAIGDIITLLVPHGLDSTGAPITVMDTTLGNLPLPPRFTTVPIRSTFPCQEQRLESIIGILVNSFEHPFTAYLSPGDQKLHNNHDGGDDHRGTKPMQTPTKQHLAEHHGVTTPGSIKPSDAYHQKITIPQISFILGNTATLYVCLQLYIFIKSCLPGVISRLTEILEKDQHDHGHLQSQTAPASQPSSPTGAGLVPQAFTSHMAFDLMLLDLPMVPEISLTSMLIPTSTNLAGHTPFSLILVSYSDISMTMIADQLIDILHDSYQVYIRKYFKQFHSSSSYALSPSSSTLLSTSFRLSATHHHQLPLQRGDSTDPLRSSSQQQQASHAMPQQQPQQQPIFLTAYDYVQFFTVPDIASNTDLLYFVSKYGSFTTMQRVIKLEFLRYPELNAQLAHSIATINSTRLGAAGSDPLASPSMVGHHQSTTGVSLAQQNLPTPTANANANAPPSRSSTVTYGRSGKDATRSTQPQDSQHGRKVGGGGDATSPVSSSSPMPVENITQLSPAHQMIMKRFKYALLIAVDLNIMQYTPALLQSILPSSCYTYAQRRDSSHHGTHQKPCPILQDTPCVGVVHALFSCVLHHHHHSMVSTGSLSPPYDPPIAVISNTKSIRCQIPILSTHLASAAYYLYDRSALLVAAEHNCLSVVHALLSYGADLHSRDRHQLSILCYAMKNRSEHCRRQLEKQMRRYHYFSSPQVVYSTRSAVSTASSENAENGSVDRDGDRTSDSNMTADEDHEEDLLTQGVSATVLHTPWSPHPLYSSSAIIFSVFAPHLLFDDPLPWDFGSIVTQTTTTTQSQAVFANIIDLLYSAMISTPHLPSDVLFIVRDFMLNFQSSSGGVLSRFSSVKWTGSNHSSKSSKSRTSSSTLGLPSVVTSSPRHGGGTGNTTTTTAATTTTRGHQAEPPISLSPRRLVAHKPSSPVAGDTRSPTKQHVSPRANDSSGLPSSASQRPWLGTNHYQDQAHRIPGGFRLPTITSQDSELEQASLSHASTYQSMDQKKYTWPTSTLASRLLELFIEKQSPTHLTLNNDENDEEHHGCDGGEYTATPPLLSSHPSSVMCNHVLQLLSRVTGHMPHQSYHDENSSIDATLQQVHEHHEQRHIGPHVAPGQQPRWDDFHYSMESHGNLPPLSIYLAIIHHLVKDLGAQLSPNHLARRRAVATEDPHPDKSLGHDDPRQYKQVFSSILERAAIHAPFEVVLYLEYLYLERNKMPFVYNTTITPSTQSNLLFSSSASSQDNRNIIWCVSQFNTHPSAPLIIQHIQTMVPCRQAVALPGLASQHAKALTIPSSLPPVLSHHTLAHLYRQVMYHNHTHTFQTRFGEGVFSNVHSHSYHASIAWGDHLRQQQQRAARNGNDEGVIDVDNSHNHQDHVSTYHTMMQYHHLSPQFQREFKLLFEIHQHVANLTLDPGSDCGTRYIRVPCPIVGTRHATSTHTAAAPHDESSLTYVIVSQNASKTISHYQRLQSNSVYIMTLSSDDNDASTDMSSHRDEDGNQYRMPSPIALTGSQHTAHPAAVQPPTPTLGGRGVETASTTSSTHSDTHHHPHHAMQAHSQDGHDMNRFISPVLWENKMAQILIHCVPIELQYTLLILQLAVARGLTSVVSHMIATSSLLPLLSYNIPIMVNGKLHIPLRGVRVPLYQPHVKHRSKKAPSSSYVSSPSFSDRYSTRSTSFSTDLSDHAAMESLSVTHGDNLPVSHEDTHEDTATLPLDEPTGDQASAYTDGHSENGQTAWSSHQDDYSPSGCVSNTLSQSGFRGGDKAALDGNSQKQQYDEHSDHDNGSNHHDVGETNPRYHDYDDSDDDDDSYDDDDDSSYYSIDDNEDDDDNGGIDAAFLQHVLSQQQHHGSSSLVQQRSSMADVLIYTLLSTFDVRFLHHYKIHYTAMAAPTTSPSVKECANSLTQRQSQLECFDMIVSYIASLRGVQSGLPISSSLTGARSNILQTHTSGLPSQGVGTPTHTQIVVSQTTARSILSLKSIEGILVRCGYLMISNPASE